MEWKQKFQKLENSNLPFIVYRTGLIFRHCQNYRCSKCTAILSPSAVKINLYQRLKKLLHEDRPFNKSVFRYVRGLVVSYFLVYTLWALTMIGTGDNMRNIQVRLYLQTTKFSLKLETKGNTPKTYAISHKTLLFVSNFKKNYTLWE